MTALKFLFNKLINLNMFLSTLVNTARIFSKLNDDKYMDFLAELKKFSIHAPGE